MQASIFTRTAARVAAIAALLAIASASHAQTFSTGAGFGSSVSLNGGSMASSGVNGNGGYSHQESNSAAAGYAAGGTGMVAGIVPVGFGGFAAGVSGSGAIGGSNTVTNSYGTVSNGGYGETKAGAGVDYSAYGYSGLNGSFAY
jgi:hypothetical protein